MFKDLEVLHLGMVGMFTSSCLGMCAAARISLFLDDRANSEAKSFVTGQTALAIATVGLSPSLRSFKGLVMFWASGFSAEVSWLCFSCVSILTLFSVMADGHFFVWFFEQIQFLVYLKFRLK